MLDRIADTFVAAVEVLEAEGRALKHGVGSLVVGAVVFALVVVVAALGVLTLIVGLTWLLAQAVGGPAAVVTTGLVVTLLAGGVGWRIAGGLRGVPTGALRAAPTPPVAPPVAAPREATASTAEAFDPDNRAYDDDAYRPASGRDGRNGVHSARRPSSAARDRFHRSH